MLVVAGVAPDLDYVSYLGGAGSFLRFDRTLLHSLLSSAALAIAIASAFYFFAVNRDNQSGEAGGSLAARFRFGRALVVCAIGVAPHLLPDLARGGAGRRLGPFRT